LALDLGKDASVATDRDWFVAAALTIRDRIVHRWLAVDRANHAQGRKRVYYLSLEFLIGRLFADVLCNLGWTEIFRAALGDLGVDLNRLRAAEPDAALGHGGLGRLAACFMESMATLGIPAYGYGIRYDHGLFRQVIKDGWQQEYPEEWLSFGNPWEFARPEVIYDIHFGGWVEMTVSPTGVKRSVWHPAETIEAVAYDIPIVGWRGRHVNPLRLWSARAVDPLRLDAFNMGDHVGALSEQTRAEAISKILYPSDATPAGLELRLRQEYFFVSASLLDLVQRHLRTDGNLYFLCRTWCSGICGPMETSTSCRFDRQSSSMTRIRASQFRNSCASSSTFTACRGTRRGVSRSAHSPTPTIRCCLKRSNPGRSICSGAFCRGTWRSSIASIRSILRQRS